MLLIPSNVTFKRCFRKSSLEQRCCGCRGIAGSGGGGSCLVVKHARTHTHIAAGTRSARPGTVAIVHSLRSVRFVAVRQEFHIWRQSRVLDVRAFCVLCASRSSRTSGCHLASFRSCASAVDLANRKAHIYCAVTLCCTLSICRYICRPFMCTCMMNMWCV